MLESAQKLTLSEALGAARQTRCLELGQGVLSRTPELFRHQFGEVPARIIADPNTYAAAGGVAFEAFRRSGQPWVEPFIFSTPTLSAEHAFVVELEEVLKGTSVVPIAVGSGTINDLTKLAAHRTGRPYMALPTAASMDGYTAFGASLTCQGAKQTFACPAPRAVVADLDVIAAAPPAMNASGYADLLAKTTAGADWLLADALGVEPLDATAWNLVQSGLRASLADPGGIPARNPAAIRLLTEGLMLGGFAMQSAQSSRPASGAEHQFSHLWDMQHSPHGAAAPSHGFKVGIGTLAVAALYEYLLAQDIQALDVDRCCESWPDQAAADQAVRALFPDLPLQAVALQESRAKGCERAALRSQLQRLRCVWPELSQRLGRQLLPFGELCSKLQAAGAPVQPQELGVSCQHLRESFRAAYFIRRRFTVLDLAVRCGLLEPALRQLFGPGGRWPIQERGAACSGSLSAPPPFKR